ncbi:MAG: oxidoreductase [Acidimicrobiia bacterium]
MSMKTNAEVVVVGAGLAGLSAAWILANSGVEVVVLEARERPGGRVLTSRVESTWIDEGGQWLGAGHVRAYNLVSELGLSTFPTFETGDSIAILNGRRIRFSGQLPKLNPLATADLAQGILRFERLVRGVSSEAPWNHPRAKDLDAKTLQSWMDRTLVSTTAKRLFGLLSAAVYAADPAEISLLFALFYTKAGRSFQTLLGTSGGAQQDRVIGGTMQLAEGLARRLGDAVRFGRPVKSISQRNGKVEIAAGKATVLCKRAIVAVPPVLAWRIDYDPPLSPAKDRLLRSLLPGYAIKAHAVYSEPFWRSEGLCGQAGCPDLPITFTFDNSPPDGSAGVLVGFAEGAHALELSRLEDADRRKIVLDCFRQYFGPQALEPSHYAERDWSRETWTRGCYAAHAPTGILSTCGAELRSPHGAVHFAGSETATSWTGYMEGALESGERVAREVMRSIGVATD